jgi:hypothetical protein
MGLGAWLVGGKISDDGIILGRVELVVVAKGIAADASPVGLGNWLVCGKGGRCADDRGVGLAASMVGAKGSRTRNVNGARESGGVRQDLGYRRRSCHGARNPLGRRVAKLVATDGLPLERETLMVDGKCH